MDDKGDKFHAVPHLFVDFDRNRGPLSGTYEYAELGSEHVGLRDFNRLTEWPVVKVEPGFGRIFPVNAVPLADSQRRMLQPSLNGVQTLYDVDGNLAILRPRDVITIAPTSSRETEPIFLEVTHVESMSVAAYLTQTPENGWRLEQAVGRSLPPDTTVTVYETRVRYSFQIEREP